MRVATGRLAASVALAAFAVWHLVAEAAFFARTSLQMDFSAVYTAGEARRLGLSPYQNHLLNVPRVWDGVARYAHSRFLYPPPVADAARVVAAVVPYRTAKVLWTFANLVFAGLSVWLAFRTSRVRPSAPATLLLVAGCAAFFPLRALLERGQFDALVLLLLMVAFHEMARERRPVLAGALIALAIVVKLHVVYLVPFLLVRRHWRVIGGVISGGLGILAVSAATSGVGPLADYFTAELPRIAARGEQGTDDTRLPESAAENATRGLPPGWTSKDGERYVVRALSSFPWNATLVRSGQGRRLELEGVSKAVVSVGAFLVLFGTFLAVQRAAGAIDRLREPRDELAYWCAALAIVLLSAPLTWTMGLVWLLPATVVLVSERWRQASGWRRGGAVLLAAGLLHAGVPDATPLRLAGGRPPGEETFVQAGLLVFIGLTLVLVGRRSSSTPESLRGDSEENRIS